MTIIICLLAGAAVGGGGVYVWHRKTILKIKPGPNPDSLGSPPAKH